MKRILYILSIAILVAACAKEQDKDYFGSDAIGFSPVADQTKTTVSIDDDAALQGTGFGVYAYYTGTNDFVSPNDATTLGKMLLNDHVSYSSGWTYTHAQYWPENGRKVSFFAYAPWTLWNGTVTANATTGIPEIPYTATTDLDNQKDILWGVGEDGYPLKNITKTSDNIVHFHFRHALSRLHFKIADFEDLESISNGIISNNWHYDSNLYDWYQITDASTKILIETITITGLYNSGKLSLNNTTSDPEWGSKSGNLTYTIEGTSLPSSIRYYSNDDDLIYNWDDLTGLSSTLVDLLDSKIIYAIPRKANEGTILSAVTITVKYHVITQVYRNYYYDSDHNKYAINRDSDGTSGTGITVSAINNVDIKGNHDESFNIEVSGKYMTLTVKANPWTLNEDELSYSSSGVTVGTPISWTPNSFDVKDKEKLYISTKTAICTFRISNPARYLWNATLIPVAGNASAFMFVDADGNEIENPNGVIGQDAILRIKVRKESSSVRNIAVLRIYAKTSDGTTIAEKLGYSETNTSTGITTYTEYNIIQDPS